MKKYALSIFALLLAFTASAQQNAINLGYCNGNMAETTDIQMNGKGWTECAIRVPQAMTAAYVGNAITAVRAALVARVNTDTLRVWVRKELNGENLVQGTILRKGDPVIAKGWNTVEFETPFDITAETGDLYIGYSLYQKANVKAVSVVEPAVANTSFMRQGDGEWRNISDKGVLSVEAVVSGGNIPAYDLGISSATVSPCPSEGIYALKVNAVVNNYGSNAVQGFTLDCSADGMQTVSTHINQQIASANSSVVSFVINPGVATDNDTRWTVTLNAIDNATDEQAGNNSIAATYTFLRNALVEEFTTEKCVNCPSMSALLHETLAKEDYNGRVFMLTHHSGFYTDDFTQPCDEEYLVFYNNNGSVYAPGVMVDRQPYFDVNSSSGKKTPVFIPQTVDQMSSVLNAELAVTANAVVGISLDFNSDSTQVTATVNCLRNANYISTSPRLNVFLTEDNVKAVSQTGGDASYRHSHLTRAYNSTWGEPVVWTDNAFTYSVTFDIDSEWDKKQMQAVAFLYNYNANDPAECIVDNSSAVDFVKTNASTTSIASANAESQKTVTGVYNLSGQHVGAKTKGLCIIKYSDGSTRKVIVR